MSPGLKMNGVPMSPLKNHTGTQIYFVWDDPRTVKTNMGVYMGAIKDYHTVYTPHLDYNFLI